MLKEKECNPDTFKGGKTTIYISKDNIEIYRDLMRLTGQTISGATNTAVSEYVNRRQSMIDAGIEEHTINHGGIEYTFYGIKLFDYNNTPIYYTSNENVLIIKKHGFEVHELDKLDQIEPLELKTKIENEIPKQKISLKNI